MRQRTIFAFGLLGLCAGCGQPPAAGQQRDDPPDGSADAADLGQQRDDLPDGSASCTDYSGSYLLGVPVEAACAPDGGMAAPAVLSQTGCAASLGSYYGQVSGNVFSASFTSGGMTVDFTMTFSGGPGSGGTYVATCTGSACPAATCTGTFTRQ